MIGHLYTLRNDCDFFPTAFMLRKFFFAHRLIIHLYFILCVTNIFHQILQSTWHFAVLLRVTGKSLNSGIFCLVGKMLYKCSFKKCSSDFKYNKFLGIFQKWCIGIKNEVGKGSGTAWRRCLWWSVGSVPWLWWWLHESTTHRHKRTHTNVFKTGEIWIRSMDCTNVNFLVLTVEMSLVRSYYWIWVKGTRTFLLFVATS